MKDKIKVLQVGTAHKAGGIESYLISYKNNMDYEKIEMHYVNVFEEAKSQPFYKELEKGSKIFNLPNYRNHPIKFIKALKQVNKIEKYDVFHYNMNSAVYLIPLIAAKLCGIKTIISHSHNTSSDKGALKAILHNINKHFIPFFANRYYACSLPAGKWFFSKKILKSNNFRVIKNAIDIDKFKFDKNIRKKIRKELKLDDDTIVLGNVGRYKPQKNQLFLIDVFYHFNKLKPNSKLMLIGFGPLENEIKDKIKKLNLEDDVLMLGERNDVNQLMQAMDLFVLPSLYEGLGIVLIEAQTSGLTCVCSDVIPDEAKISKEFYKISLKEKPELWAKKIVKNYKGTRVLDNDCLIYDIKSCAKKLSGYYINDSKIKLCHFVNGIVNGGVERVILNYFSNIKNRDDYELHIITQGESDQKCYKEFEDLGFKIHCVTKKKESIVNNYNDIMKILKDKKFDIVHCHMTTTNLFPLFYSFLAGVKIRINHSHLSVNNMNIITKIYMFISEFFSTHKFACSKDAAKYMFGSTRNVSIINNAINLEKFQYDLEIRNKKRNELKIEDKIVVGHVGRFVEQKNHEFLIDLFNELHKNNDKYELILIGVGELEDNIKNKVKELNLEDSVHFLGTRDDVNELMQAMDIFLLPSLFEGLGIVLIEAQVSGLKCFCSSNTPCEVEITENIKLLDLNIENWKKEISNIKDYNRRNYINRISEKGFNILEEAEKLDKMYKYALRK